MEQLSFTEIQKDILKKIVKDKSFKKLFIENPKQILTEQYGITFPNGEEIKVHENTKEIMHFVIPIIPEGKLTDAQLSAIAGGSSPASKSKTEGVTMPPAA
jgi:hypothetical protein